MGQIRACQLGNMNIGIVEFRQQLTRGNKCRPARLQFGGTFRSDSANLVDRDEFFKLAASLQTFDLRGCAVRRTQRQASQNA